MQDAPVYSGAAPGTLRGAWIPRNTLYDNKLRPVQDLAKRDPAPGCINTHQRHAARLERHPTVRSAQACRKPLCHDTAQRSRSYVSQTGLKPAIVLSGYTAALGIVRSL